MQLFMINIQLHQPNIWTALVDENVFNPDLDLTLNGNPNLTGS